MIAFTDSASDGADIDEVIAGNLSSQKMLVAMFAIAKLSKILKPYSTQE